MVRALRVELCRLIPQLVRELVPAQPPVPPFGVESGEEGGEVEDRRGRPERHVGTSDGRGVHSGGRPVLSPTSTYSAGGGLRQDPGGPPDSPIVPVTTSAFALPDR